MRNLNSIREQLRRNTVALISLAVALSSLAYNTWRNEQTEYNRNIRHAAFEMLVRLGELQQVADHLHYDRDEERGNPITGWGYVAVIRDLARVMPEPVRTRSETLFEAWEKNWDALGQEDKAINAITGTIGATREAVINALESLD